ncbi:MAG: DUF1467 family protein [Alphaproteobacteria bacterium]|nr:MAG: DUF1467 family protein [Alphaproteobacteria bacterium]
MSTFTTIASFIVLWWISLFLVLPFGAQSQIDDGEVKPGTEPGAPSSFSLVKKALMATGLALFFLVILIGLVESNLFDPRDSSQDPWAKPRLESTDQAGR